jgi:flagellar basal body rod protein FlgB
MVDGALGLVEQGLEVAQLRARVLAEDAANARSGGFRARDVTPEAALTERGLEFAAAVREAPVAGESGTIEFAMGATAENSLRFRALADQERAMLREYRSVADEARR